MQSTKAKNCPTCRESFDELEVEPLPGMNITPLESDKFGDINREDDRESSEFLCSEHLLRYLFWCNDCKLFFCKKGLKKEHRFCDYDFLEDSIANIKGAIHDKVCLVNENIELDANKTQIVLADLTVKKSHLRIFFKLLEEELKCVSKNIDKLKELELTRKEVKQIGDKLDTEEDVKNMNKWYNTLSKMDSRQKIIEKTERKNNPLHLLSACLLVSN